MKRLRLATWAVVAGLGLVSGCSSFGSCGSSSCSSGSGGLFSRFRNHSRADCPCETCSGGSCGSCETSVIGGGPTVEGPLLGEPAAPVIPMLPAVPPTTLMPENAVPPLAPPPRIAPQAQPTPAGPASRVR